MAAAMKQQSNELLTLRCRATECVGAVAIAIGKDKFQPFLKDFMQLAVQGLLRLLTAG